VGPRRALLQRYRGAVHGRDGIRRLLRDEGPALPPAEADRLRGELARCEAAAERTRREYAELYGVPPEDDLDTPPE
jgi:hypothetical protein